LLIRRFFISRLVRRLVIRRFVWHGLIGVEVSRIELRFGKVVFRIVLGLEYFLGWTCIIRFLVLLRRLGASTEPKRSGFGARPIGSLRKRFARHDAVVDSMALTGDWRRRMLSVAHGASGRSPGPSRSVPT